MATPPGFSFQRTEASGELGVCRTVGQQRISDEFSVINRSVADLTASVRANAQSLECAIHVVQGRLNGGDTLVIEIGHNSKLTPK